MLKNAALDAKIGVDTAENEPQKVSEKWGLYRTPLVILPSNTLSQLRLASMIAVASVPPLPEIPESIGKVPMHPSRKFPPCPSGHCSKRRVLLPVRADGFYADG